MTSEFKTIYRQLSKSKDNDREPLWKLVSLSETECEQTEKSTGLKAALGYDPSSVIRTLQSPTTHLHHVINATRLLKLTEWETEPVAYGKCCMLHYGLGLSR